jgi:hypothetical protein
MGSSVLPERTKGLLTHLVRRSACRADERDSISLAGASFGMSVCRRVAHRTERGCPKPEAEGSIPSAMTKILEGGAWRHATGLENRADLTVEGSTP